MTSLSVELNRQSLCVSSGRLRDVCETSNYAVCPGAAARRRRQQRQQQQHDSRRAVRQTDSASQLPDSASESPLTVSIVLYAPRTYEPRQSVIYSTQRRRSLLSRGPAYVCVIVII